MSEVRPETLTMERRDYASAAGSANDVGHELADARASLANDGRAARVVAGGQSRS